MEKTGENRYPRARQARWDKVHLVTVSTHLRAEEMPLWRMACMVAGRTPYAVVRDLVRGFIEDTLDLERGSIRGFLLAPDE